MKKQFTREYSKAEIEKVLKKHGLWEEKSQNPEKYLLYVGAIQPRKNLMTLVNAFERLKKREENKTLKLVLVGEAAWKEGETFEKIERSPNKNDIVLTGKVDFENLPIFYQNAAIFIFPPLYEGFGIPVLEAMAAETPVVVANNSSLVEVGGDTVMKFKSKNSNELNHVLQKILKSSIIRNEMTEKGKKQTENFSWGKCAKKTLAILKNK